MSVVSKLLSLILNNSIVQWLIGGLMAVLALFVGSKLQQRKGRKQAEQEHADADAEEAAAILDRVRESDGLPDDEEQGYRD